MVKFDVEAAYRNIPLHPSELYLFGMYWHDNYFVDLTCPFVFTQPLLSFIKWLIYYNGFSRTDTGFAIYFTIWMITLVLGPAFSDECASNVAVARSVFTRLGLPLHQV